MKKKKRKVIAILTADWHLSHKPPVWRSNEPDWYTAMARPLNEISNLAGAYDCPVLVAGDIFDKWNSPAELINFAIKAIDFSLYAIPGQHDLPNHNTKELHRSAYASLYLSGKLQLGMPMYTNWFGYGTKLKERPYHDAPIEVAITHDYVWIRDHSYPNAPKEKRIDIRSRQKHMVGQKYYGYDVIVYGDNHKGFQTCIGDTVIFNCGTLMRRASDEENYKPQVGLLFNDGSVEPYELDISKDKHLTAEEAKEVEEFESLDMTQLAAELKKLGSTALDFANAVKCYLTKIKAERPVRDIINKAMEK